jgi:alpha-1,3-rhamnosyltransferase
VGCAATLNKGFSMASGQYVCPLASDDWIVSDKTSIQVAYLEENPNIAACGGNIIAVDEKGNNLKKQKNENFRTLGFEDVFLGRKRGLPAPTAMIRKDVFFEVGGFDPAIKVEDIYLWLKITKRGYPLAVLKDKLAFYRKHDSNIHYDHEFMLKHLEKVYEPYKSEEGYDYIINKCRVSHLLGAAKAGNKRFAWETLKKVPFRYQSKKTFKALLHICKPTLIKELL